MRYVDANVFARVWFMPLAWCQFYSGGNNEEAQRSARKHNKDEMFEVLVLDAVAVTYNVKALDSNALRKAMEKRGLREDCPDD